MGQGRNANREGARSNELYQLQALNRIVGAITGGGIPSPTGLATETTLAALLAATIAGGGQEIEILLVRDTGNNNEILQQITDYTTGTPVVIYRDVNGNVVTPVGPLEYLDPSAVMNLMLTAIQAQGLVPQATEATQLLVDSNIVLGNLTLNEIDTVLDSIKTDTAYLLGIASVLGLISTDISAMVVEQLAQGLSLDSIRNETAVTSAALAATVRTPALLVVSGIANTTVAAGARSVTFFNQGPTDATVAGGVLSAGEEISFDAGGQLDTLGAITYVTIATGVLKIGTVV